MLCTFMITALFILYNAYAYNTYIVLYVVVMLPIYTACYYVIQII